MSYKKKIEIIILAIIIAGSSVAVKANAASAKLNYRFYCAACHGLEGRGDGPNNTPTQPVKPRDHTNAAKMGQMSDMDIIDVIKQGGAATNRSRMMPPFGNTLKESEISALKDYLRGLCKCSERIAR